MIDYEHQTLNAEKNGQPAPAAGWFKNLEWCEGDGLYMRDITWSDKARQMIAAREYHHLSPVFRFDPATGAVLEIIGAALTNNPALTGLVDLAAASARFDGTVSAMEALVKRFRDDELEIPRCTEAVRNAQAMQIAAEYEDGASNAELALRYSFTERGIRKVRQRAARLRHRWCDEGS